MFEKKKFPNRSKTPQETKKLNKSVRKKTPQNYSKIMTRDVALSPSPFPKSERLNDDYLKKHLMQLKTLEKRLRQEQNDLIDQHKMQRQRIIKGESKIVQETAKIETEREKIIFLLIQLMLNNKVIIDIPQQEKSKTKSSKISKQNTDKSSTQNSSKDQNFSEELNFVMKESLRNNVNSLPSSLRALLRCKGESFEQFFIIQNFLY